MVLMGNRILHLLDAPGGKTVIMSAIHWMGAFNRLDPTITISKLITMGVEAISHPYHYCIPRYRDNSTAKICFGA